MADVCVYRVGVVVLDDGTGAVPDMTGFEVVTTDGGVGYLHTVGANWLPGFA